MRSHDLFPRWTRLAAAARAVRVGRAGLCALALLAAALVLAGCAGGPKPLDVVIPGGPVDAGQVFVIEYAGSDAGEPVPGWVGVPAGELESAPEHADSYVFRFSFEAETLEELQASLRDFPERGGLAGVILDRALAKTRGIRDLPEDLVDRAVRIVTAVEYAGTTREGEFWVHEQVITEESTRDRYRGWLLYIVPRDQVHAGLLLAYENAAASFPPRTEPDLRAREQLLERFRDGL